MSQELRTRYGLIAQALLASASSTPRDTKDVSLVVGLKVFAMSVDK